MLEQHVAYALVLACSGFSILWGVINIFLIRRVNMDDASKLMKRKREGEEEGFLDKEKQGATTPEEAQELLKKMKEIQAIIEEGAIVFLRQEYLYLSIFIALFSILLIFTVEPQLGVFYTTVAYLVGGGTSILAGYIGMRIAVYTNVRVTKECATGVHEGFVVAYRGGQVLGFVLTGLALLILMVIVIAYTYLFLGPEETDISKARLMFEMIAGYGLGASTVALFGRVGGGIYTKAADVGADLAGKVVHELEEDDSRNAGVIADNVGDNVGDIAGMGSDLFGSLAESSCAALVVAATSQDLVNTVDAIYFPLMVISVGILVSFATTFIATNTRKVTLENIENTVKWQLIISTVVMTAAIIPLVRFLPASFQFSESNLGVTCTAWKAYGCVACGLWSGLIIGFITEYFTSNKYGPVQGLAEACRMGPAPNIILGLSLGYFSIIIPILCLAITIFFAFTWGEMYGIALAALGMLGCLPIALSIDGYGPIADNAGGIAEMVELDESVRVNTDHLDAAGNTTAAIGKGFAIGSAALVALSLFGAFVTRTEANDVNILQPMAFACLLVGAMIPFAFSALTMEAVGLAANEMIHEIKKQLEDEEVRNRQKPPDYDACIAISTKASLKKMIVPGILVIGSPLLVGILFGPAAVCGLLAGILVSGVQIAFSFSNTGGAWDNCKKYIEANKYYSTETEIRGDENDNGRYKFMKKSDAHKAAVVGDTVGDPLKDTSGPSINILIKLSAITSLIFGTFFARSGGILMRSRATITT